MFNPRSELPDSASTSESNTRTHRESSCSESSATVRCITRPVQREIETGSDTKYWKAWDGSCTTFGAQAGIDTVNANSRDSKSSSRNGAAPRYPDASHHVRSEVSPLL